LFLSLAVAGCAVDGGDGAGTDIGESVHAVANPTPAGARDLLALVQVFVPDNGPHGAQCTGVVIASDTVLTAAHCLCTQNFVGGNVCQAFAVVSFRPDPSTGIRALPISGTGTVEPDYNPSWTENQLEHDVAVIELDGVAPAYIPPLRVADDYPDEGDDVMVTGFGKTGRDCQDDSTNTLNFAFAPVDGYEDGWFGPPDIMRFTDRPLCPGDSGGAVLDADATRVFAVNSGERVSDREDLAITTASEFDWIKSFMCPSSPTNQCDGDGWVCDCTASTDILWRDASGQLAIWFEGQPDGAAFPGYHDALGPVDLSWQVKGTGDFDGDGHSDILWRHTSGQVAVWFMNGAAMIGEAYPGGSDPGGYYHIEGVADFDGDGRSDILWRSAGGWLGLWPGAVFEDAVAIGYHNVPGPVDPSWSVKGLGDFDADGRADIIWRHSGGQVAIV